MSKEVAILYRYYSCQSVYGGVYIGFEVHTVLKRTPKGYWIGPPHNAFSDFGHRSRWVSDGSRKRFAYPTKKEALFNFVARKVRQMEILGHRLEEAKDALKQGKNMLKNMEEDKC